MQDTDDGLVIMPQPLHGGLFATYDDHRLATAAAVLGLRVPGVEVDDSRPPPRPCRASSTSGPSCSGEQVGAAAPRSRRGRRPGPPVARLAPPHQGPARHEDATQGFVVAVDRGRYTCRVGDMTSAWTAPSGSEVVAMKARELGRRGVVVGDRVGIVGDVSGDTDALARIVRSTRARSTLRRTADDTDPSNG